LTVRGRLLRSHRRRGGKIYRRGGKIYRRGGKIYWRGGKIYRLEFHRQLRGLSLPHRLS
jgi:hypothetical protein